MKYSDAIAMRIEQILKQKNLNTNSLDLYEYDLIIIAKQQIF